MFPGLNVLGGRMTRWIAFVSRAAVIAALCLTFASCARFDGPVYREGPDRFGSYTSPLYDPHASPVPMPFGRPRFPPHTEGP